MWRLVSICVGLIVASTAVAEFPNAPVKAVVTFPPGGPADVMAPERGNEPAAQQPCPDQPQGRQPRRTEAVGEQLPVRCTPCRRAVDHRDSPAGRD